MEPAVATALSAQSELATEAAMDEELILRVTQSNCQATLQHKAARYVAEHGREALVQVDAKVIRKAVKSWNNCETQRLRRIVKGRKPYECDPPIDWNDPLAPPPMDHAVHGRYLAFNRLWEESR